MSKIIASAAIRGAHKIAHRVETKYAEALKKYGPARQIGFPDTAYYLPIIYAMLGIPVQPWRLPACISCRPASFCRRWWRRKRILPYLAPALDAGMATLFYEEIEEAIRYLEAAEFLSYR